MNVSLISEGENLAKLLKGDEPELNNLKANGDMQSHEASLVDVKTIPGESNCDKHFVENDSNLPEGFFDDPVQDAKVKHKAAPYRTPIF